MEVTALKDCAFLPHERLKQELVASGTVESVLLLNREQAVERLRFGRRLLASSATTAALSDPVRRRAVAARAHAVLT